jgi:predicted RNA polymerase sigma factor
MAVRATVEAVARDHYGRLLAPLAVAWRDPAAVEDALATAFAHAVAQWPQRGIPEHPQAWLSTMAGNALRQGLRHRRLAAALQPELRQQVEAALDEAQRTADARPDDRLRRMFVCAHPAIDARVRSALMLQLVLGIEVRRMASAFLLPPATLAQRLVRAKQKIKLAAVGRPRRATP